MTTSDAPSEGRRRGGIRRHGDGWQARVSAGTDPSTGERIVLYETVPIPEARTKAARERAEREAFKEAQKVLTRLQAEADALKVGRTKATVGALLERWMEQHEIDPTTRMTYDAQIRLYIVPNLGDVPLVLFVREAAERLEKLYGRLRKCRALCNGRPFIENHAEQGPHDCATAGCKPHVCKPYAASSVRSIHAILSGACSAAVRWGWISFNPMPSVRPPAKPRPQPRPPTSEQMARIVEAAWTSSAEWGLYVWLSAVLGARRGEVVALQWEDIDLAAGVVRLDENYVRTNDGMVLKDTKSHQMRRVSVDAPTIELLRQHREDCAGRLALLGVPLTDRTWVFSAKPDLSSPRDPASLTRRYGRLVAKLGIDTVLKELRHYSATELLTAGVDLRTVAGRLGHGDGTTTLRHYAAWVGSADTAAAGVIGGRMPVLRPVDRLPGDPARSARNLRHDRIPVDPKVGTAPNMAELATSSSEALTESTARRALTRACQRVGLPHRDAELMRIGSNAVFRVDAATIARVAPSLAHRENAQKQIDVARWLREIDYPATRALDIEQPVDAEGRVVTFWESIAPETRYAPIRDVARLTRQLHYLDVPPTLALPALQPFGAPGDPFPDLAAIPRADAHFLRERLEWARSRFPCLPFALPTGVVHGDANVGNVLVDDGGRAVLIDLDSFSIGPREWDLVQTALFYDRLGWHTRDEYTEFVNVYGYDLMSWSGYGELADMREIAMTTWLCKRAAHSVRTAAEAGKRVAAIRTGSSRRDWGAY